MTVDESAREKLWGLVKKYRYAMLTTQEAGEALRSRPMTTIEREYDGTLWFFAAADSTAATALGDHPQICLTYSNTDNFDFVTVSGSAEVITDVARKKALWQPAVQAWFPQGPDSAHNVLIKVTPEQAEYWDSKSNKLVQLFSIAKALATGTTPRDLGEHRSVPMPGAVSGVRS
jgi:general stress protein 26